MQELHYCVPSARDRARWRTTGFLLSFIVPILGIVNCAIFYGKSDRESKDFGVKCLNKVR